MRHFSFFEVDLKALAVVEAACEVFAKDTFVDEAAVVLLAEKVAQEEAAE